MSCSKKKHYNITKLFEQFFLLNPKESKSTFVGETKRKEKNMKKKINLIPCITLTEAAFII